MVDEQDPIDVVDFMTDCSRHQAFGVKSQGFARFVETGDGNPGRSADDVKEPGEREAAFFGLDRTILGGNLRIYDAEWSAAILVVRIQGDDGDRFADLIGSESGPVLGEHSGFQVLEQLPQLVVDPFNPAGPDSQHRVAVQDNAPVAAGHLMPGLLLGTELVGDCGTIDFQLGVFAYLDQEGVFADVTDNAVDSGRKNYPVAALE